MLTWGQQECRVRRLALCPGPTPTARNPPGELRTWPSSFPTTEHPASYHPRTCFPGAGTSPTSRPLGQCLKASAGGSHPAACRVLGGEKREIRTQAGTPAEGSNWGASGTLIAPPGRSGFTPARGGEETALNALLPFTVGFLLVVLTSCFLPPAPQFQSPGQSGVHR